MEKVKEEDKTLVVLVSVRTAFLVLLVDVKEILLTKQRRKQLMKTEGRQLKRISRRAHSVLEIEGLHLNFNPEH